MSMPLADSVVDWSGILNVIWAASLGGVGVTVAFSLTLLGATRAVELRRDGRLAAAGAYAALTALCGVAVLLSVVFGVVVMTAKS
jgi:hypothetical protein